MLPLDEQDNLVWTRIDEGEQVTFSKEPDTSWWTRFSVKLLSFIVPEKQL
jgi:putative cardiolipin synthase